MPSYKPPHQGFTGVRTLPSKPGGVVGPPPLLELLLERNGNFFAAHSAAKKNIASKHGNETRFFQKEHFVLPLQLIYVVSDQIFHCRRVVMKNFWGEIILLYTKN